MFQDAAREDAHFQMRRLQRFSAPRHAARLDRFEFTRAVFVRNLAPESTKRRIDRFHLPVVWMIVFSVRIRLPDFDQRVGDAFAVAVKHRTQEFQALAFCVQRRASARTQFASVTVTEKYGPTVHHGVGSSSRAALLFALKRRALPSAQHDVKPEPQRPARFRAIHFKSRDHSLPRAFIPHGIENRIERK